MRKQGQLKWTDLHLNWTYKIVTGDKQFIGKLIWVQPGLDVYDEPEFFLFRLGNESVFEIHHYEFNEIYHLMMTKIPWNLRKV
ncbi:hypothetical protein [Bacillus alkalicellulosilyticus]|uniref:hypothetical protein n=1 Tax=Alkalihalobacterium alkalicellulosilyticum TaxID=1912214 RepID=UPI0009988D62|nr:hypothetical protein [Bacillus alkalicellulosilyticus]